MSNRTNSVLRIRRSPFARLKKVEQARTGVMERRKKVVIMEKIFVMCLLARDLLKDKLVDALDAC